ncbi:hypothetical protein [Ideonella sp. YS5]|uniref:hypothetical protein n=1 Tax=Ideonella sp. YS5 TaxID=3453714 RepID=UPI003EECE658
MDHVARTLNQSREYIASWVNPDGSLCRKMYYVARLEGFETHRDEVKGLLQKLGHHEAAEALPAEAPRGPAPKPDTGSASGSGTRRNHAAEDVLNILTAARAGKAVPEIMAEFGYTKSTVNRWISKTKWAGENLAQTLARMEGYEAHRPALQRLAGAFDLHQGDLPDPAAQRKQHVSAKILCRALTALVERLEHPRADQIKDTLEALGQAVGLAKNTIAKWLKADGSPRIALASLARLADYGERRVELQRLLKRLGHAEVAKTLPAGAGSSRAYMTTRLLVQALEQAGRGLKSTHAVAAALNISGNLLGGFLTISGGSVRLVDPGCLSSLPDYRSEREGLLQALRTLGLEDDARSLPAIKVSATEFLQGLRGKGREAAAAIAELQRDPRLSPADAARRHGLPPDEFAVAVRPGGLVRDRARVEERLERLEPHLSQGLDELLAALRRASKGEASGSGGTSSLMKRVQLAPAGNEPAKVFIVPQGDTTGSKRSQLENLYVSNAGLVRGPRSYEGERDRQALRWLSTTLRLLVPDSSEIQCYFDERTGSIAVAAGRTSDLRKIQSLLAGGDFRATARGELNKLVDSMSEREYRHVQKLFGHLKARRKGEDYDPAADLVLDAILKNAFVVPIESFSANGRTFALHAERRLNHWSKQTHGEPLDPAHVAGTMRPCGTCAEDLALPDEAHRGPFWLSAAAQANIDTDGAVQRQIDRSIGTSVTRTRENRLTVDVDTDSESDA